MTEWATNSMPDDEFARELDDEFNREFDRELDESVLDHDRSQVLAAMADTEIARLDSDRLCTESAAERDVQRQMEDAEWDIERQMADLEREVS